MPRSLLLQGLALLLLAAACSNGSDPAPADTDADGDGVLAADDCDDTDPSSTVVATDGDCDGVLTADDCDDTDASLNFDDADTDGHSTCDGDCDDADPFVNPGASDGLLTDRDCVEGIADNNLARSEFHFVGERVGGSSPLATRAGSSVSSAGDVDGDGLDDLLVGAHDGPGGTGSCQCAGKAYLILGRSLGAAETDLSLADYSFVGERSGDDFGVSVSSAGDVDGDGLDDILVGAFTNDVPTQNNMGGGGKTYLFLGSSLGASSEIDHSLADYSFGGENDHDRAGYSVSSAGDVDGDGLGDLLVGIRHWSDGVFGTVKAYLILGGSLGTTSQIDLSLADYSFVGETTGWDYDGLGVSSAGDVDGDGLDDILVGTLPGSNNGGVGKAYLILGASLGTTSEIDLSLADYSFEGEQLGPFHAGYSVSSAGDANGDGLDDVLVGAPTPLSTSNGGYPDGKAYLVLSGL